VTQRRCVIGVRRSERRSDLFFKRQNVQTFRPLNTGTSCCPETPCTSQPVTRRTVKYFKIKTGYIYLKLNSKDLAKYFAIYTCKISRPYANFDCRDLKVSYGVKRKRNNHWP